MDFKKDLLLIDLETTGLDASRHEIIQLAAILLDKKTLAEKEVFDTFVRPAKWRTRDRESMAINGISWQQVQGAPRLPEVIKNFDRLFGHDVILSHYGGPLDMDFLRAAYKKYFKEFPFDHHYFNLWGLFFSYLAAQNKLKNTRHFTGFTLDGFLKVYRLKSNNRHDALEDCRLEAEILRRVMKDLQ